ncbi:MAG: hypothetical protein RR620_07275 [Clostridium sp.]
MKKPSIFSKDYEKQMRKRRRKMILIGIILCLGISGTYLYVTNDGIDFSAIKVKLQAWVDSGKEVVDEEDSVLTNAPVVEPEPEPEKIETIDVLLDDGTEIKVSLNKDENGVVTFNEVLSGTGVVISPDKTRIMFVDNKQDIRIVNTLKEETVVSKENYQSTQGSTYTKESILQQNEGYVWHKDARFLSDTKIMYVTNLPYFGQNLNQFIWTLDLQTGEHKTNWAGKAKEIIVGEFGEKGLEINLDGKIKYVTIDGNIIE